MLVGHMPTQPYTPTATVLALTQCHYYILCTVVLYNKSVLHFFIWLATNASHFTLKLA